MSALLPWSQIWAMNLVARWLCGFVGWRPAPVSPEHTASTYLVVLHFQLDDIYSYELYACRAWDLGTRTPRGPGSRAGGSPIKSLTTDEDGHAWVGNDKGAVRRVLRVKCTTDGGEDLVEELRLVGALQHSGKGQPEPASAAAGEPCAGCLGAGSPAAPRGARWPCKAASKRLPHLHCCCLFIVCVIPMPTICPRCALPPLSPHAADPETGLVSSLMAKLKAHEGPVTALAATGGRVWTSGGSAAFLCLREWSARGEFLYKHDLRDVGAVTAMMLTSPLVRVVFPLDHATSAGSSILSSSGDGQYGRQVEVPHAWQLVTGHGSGMVQVWGMVRNRLQALLRVGQRMSPITGLSVCEPLAAICTSHLGECLPFRKELERSYPPSL